jgi:hypothetical protein
VPDRLKTNGKKDPLRALRERAYRAKAEADHLVEATEPWPTRVLNEIEMLAGKAEVSPDPREIEPEQERANPSPPGAFKSGR